MKLRKMIALVASTAVMSTLLPLAAEAQRAPYRIGYLALLPNEDATVGAPFFQRLQELGYNAGKTIIVDYRSAEGYAQRLPQLASEMVRAKPDVIIAGFGTLAPKAAIAATTSIPIVFTSVGDPVGAGLVASLNQPGANVTGLSAQAKTLPRSDCSCSKNSSPAKRWSRCWQTLIRPTPCSRYVN